MRNTCVNKHAHAHAHARTLTLNCNWYETRRNENDSFQCFVWLHLIPVICTRTFYQGENNTKNKRTDTKSRKTLNIALKSIWLRFFFFFSSFQSIFSFWDIVRRQFMYICIDMYVFICEYTWTELQWTRSKKNLKKKYATKSYGYFCIFHILWTNKLTTRQVQTDTIFVFLLLLHLQEAEKKIYFLFWIHLFDTFKSDYYLFTHAKWQRKVLIFSLRVIMSMRKE